MPDLQFVLPHWLYWAGLIVFPLFAMVMVRRQRAAARPPAVSLVISYFLLITAGFVGIHRFYVKNWKGVVYIPLFFGIIYANIQGRDAREAVSLADSDVMIADFDLERAQQTADAEDASPDAAASLDQAKAHYDAAQLALDGARQDFARWSETALYLAVAIAVLLLIDVALLPRLVRLCREREAAEPPPDESRASPTEEAVPAAPAGIGGWLQMASRYSGEFVAYWSVLAVFAYYYEVLARYIFNSPTNWVHEGMFLMFGMMYLISGAYAYMTDSHVRVDIFYARLPPRGKALTDLLTSVFFFIFAGTLMATGWIFFMDSFGVREVSFTEWAIQYWPVKITVVLGAALILLQGIAKMLADLAIVMAPGR